jgi:hypothetical protein
VLGQARAEVRMVVLDRDVLDALPGQRVGGREVVRVEIVHDNLGRDREQVLEVRHALGEGAERLDVLEVADVVRDPRAPPAGDAERALELRPAREHVASRRHRQRERARHGTARAPQRQRPPARDPQHRVVGPRLDRPVVAEHEVRDPGEALERVVVAVGDRLVGHVAARHHQRLADAGQQQVVERAVREHHSQLGRAGGDRIRHPRVAPPRREHDRAVAAAQQRRLDGPEHDEPPGGLQVRRHQRKRLLLTVLPRPKRRHRPLVGRQAREMEPTDPLHRNDRTLGQRGHGNPNGV